MSWAAVQTSQLRPCGSCLRSGKGTGAARRSSTVREARWWEQAPWCAPDGGRRRRPAPAQSPGNSDLPHLLPVNDGAGGSGSLMSSRSQEGFAGHASRPQRSLGDAGMPPWDGGPRNCVPDSTRRGRRRPRVAGWTFLGSIRAWRQTRRAAGSTSGVRHTRALHRGGRGEWEPDPRRRQRGPATDLPSDAVRMSLSAIDPGNLCVVRVAYSTTLLEQAAGSLATTRHGRSTSMPLATRSRSPCRSATSRHPQASAPPGFR